MDKAERHRQSTRRWRIANPERAAASEARWRAANPDRHRRFCMANPTAVAAHRAHFRTAHPDAWRENARRQKRVRRARIANVLATLTAAEWNAILEAAGHACIYCGSQEKITQDHLIPISRGGDHTAENVAPACLPCNQSKGVKAVAEFLAERRS